MRASLMAALLAAWPAIAFSGQDCSDPAGAAGPVHYNDDYHYSLDADQMAASFEEHLRSGRRMQMRGWRDGGRYVAGLYRLTIKPPYPLIENVEVPERVIQGMAAHLIQAFSSGWARHPFMPDMGHGHLLLPWPTYEHIRDSRLSEKDKLERILNHPNLEVLYHAAEHLRFDPPQTGEMRFRRRHRNIVGSMATQAIRNVQAAEQSVNTAGPPPGWTEVGIVYVTGGSDGCLPFIYEGRQIYLDFALTFTPPSGRERDDDR